MGGGCHSNYRGLRTADDKHGLILAICGTKSFKIPTAIQKV